MASERVAILPREPREAAPAWSRGPLDPQLGPGSLHVWRVDLDAVGDGLAESLDEAERYRAERIGNPRDRRLWSRSRGALRTLLARYARVAPSAIELVAGEHGKPLLAASLGPAAPAFNLSHSASLALFAFVADGAVGIDLEVFDGRRRGPEDRLSLARRRFGADAARSLEQLDGALREREFLRFWVRYEAELKRRGTGIGASDPAAVDPALADLAVSGKPTTDPSDCPWIAELDVGPRAAAALALGSRASELRQWSWP
jgi:4'-phosphopantetheinyl transferase